MTFNLWSRFLRCFSNFDWFQTSLASAIPIQTFIEFTSSKASPVFFSVPSELPDTNASSNQRRFVRVVLFPCISFKGEGRGLHPRLVEWLHQSLFPYQTETNNALLLKFGVYLLVILGSWMPLWHFITTLNQILTLLRCLRTVNVFWALFREGFIWTGYIAWNRKLAVEGKLERA